MSLNHPVPRSDQFDPDSVVWRATDARVDIACIRQRRGGTCVVGESWRTSRSVTVPMCWTDRIIDTNCVVLDWAPSGLSHNAGA